MVNILNKIKKLDVEYKILIFFLMIFFILKLNSFLLVQNKFWWDEVVYVSLAKFFYSFGNLGFFDGVRPAFFSLFLGFFWFVGFEIIFISKLIVIIFSILNLYLVYKISENIYEGSGLYSTLILGSTSMFLFVSNLIISEQFSLFFVLLGFYLILKNKPFFAGFALSIAFLSRFFNGIFLVILFSYFIFNNFNKNNFLFSLKGIVPKFLKYMFGFIILVLPYLIMNYIYFNDMFHTIKRASLVVLDSAFLYDFSYFFYIVVLLKENLIFLFVILFLIFFNFNSSLWKSTKINYLLVVFFVPLIYLSIILTHKEARYVFSILPFAAILGGIFFTFILDIYTSFNMSKIFKFFIILIYLILFLGNNSIAYNSLFEYNEQEIDLYNYFENSNEEIVLLTNDITFLMFTEFEVYSLPFYDFWENKFYESNNTITHIVFKECDFYCVDGLECEEKDSFFEFLENQKILIDEEILISKNTYCNFKIYEVVEGLR